MASENEKTVFGIPGLPLESPETAPSEREESETEKTIVGLSFGADELAQLESAIASVEQRSTGASDVAASKPSTPRAAPLPPPRPRGTTAAAPVVSAPPAAAPPENGTMLLSAADFGDLDQLLSASPTSETAAPPAPAAVASTPSVGGTETKIFDADDVGDALSGVFGQITSAIHASDVEARVQVKEDPDEVDAAFAATEVVSTEARVAALAAWEEEQKTAAAKADIRPSAPAPKAEPAAPPTPVSAPAPATAAGTLLMSSELIEQAAAAAVAAARPIAPKPEPQASSRPVAAPTANATLLLDASSVGPDSSSTRKAYAAADLADGKTEIPAPEKTKRYQTGAAPRVEARSAQRDSVRRQPAMRQPARTDAPEIAPTPRQREGAALWIAGLATVLVLLAIAWFLLR